MVENRKSCWYYDDQMDNRLTSVSLHPNTVYKGDTWVRASQAGLKVDAGGYTLSPLCRSVLNEDFNVSIANTWSDMGGDPISGWVNDVMHSAAPYAGAISTAIEQIRAKADEWGAKNKVEIDEKTGKEKFSVAHKLKGFADWVGDRNEAMGGDLVDYMNANFIVQGTRFSYYSGTGISFGNLGMRFTIFPQWLGKNELLTVNQQLETLFPYAIGKYESLHFTTGEGENKTEHVSDILGWQRPPAGYRADYKDIDNKSLKGTLKLRIGAFYVLESLVCEGITFSLSRQMVKKPFNAGYSGLNVGYSRIINDMTTDTIAFSPLYADVNIVLRPSTKYSDLAMKNFIYGLNMPTNQGEERNEGAQELDQKIKSNLKGIQNDISEKYV